MTVQGKGKIGKNQRKIGDTGCNPDRAGYGSSIHPTPPLTDYMTQSGTLYKGFICRSISLSRGIPHMWPDRFVEKFPSCQIYSG